MFLIDQPRVPYFDPWDLSLAERLALLKRGQPRIAYYYRWPDNSTFRYRVYNMIQALQAAESNVSASFFHRGDLAAENEIVDACDAIVFCRAPYDDAVARLINKARARDRTIFFDVDDLAFNPDYTHLLVTALDQNTHDPLVWATWFADISRLGATLKLCDRAIVTNEILAGRVREFHDVPVSIVSNFLNLEQLAVSDAIFDSKRQTRFARDEKIHLGYFSGTPTHNRDFGLIAEMLARLLREDPRLVVRLAGYLPVPACLEPFGERIERHAFRDFVNLQTLVGSTEINLVPLQDSIFSNCKSDLKYFEAAVVGTATIASPTQVFRQSISDGVDGYLAETFDWPEKIYRIIDSFDRYATMAEIARNRARSKFHWSTQAKAIERVFAH